MSAIGVESGSHRRDETSGRNRRRIRTRHIALVVAAVALAIFAIGYWIPAYRYDEYLVAVARADLSWRQLLRHIVMADPAPGPWYVLMKVWAALSSDPAWTRIPSLLSMAVAVAALVAFVRRAVDTRTAVFAGLVAVALPGMSRWAQDNRMYAAATAFLVLALLCWWISITGGRRRWSALYGASVVAMGLLHLYTLAWIPVLVVTGLFLPQPRRTMLLRTLVPAGVAFVLLAPHLLLNLATPTGSPGNPPASVTSLATMVGNNVGGFLGPLVALLAVAGAVVAWRRPDRRATAVLGVAWLTLPLVEFIAARVVLHMPTLVDRYYVFALPGLCVLAALALDAIAVRSRTAAVVVLVLIAALALPDQVQLRAADAHRVDLYRLGQILRQPELDGLPVVATRKGAATLVNAATYPDEVLAPRNAPPGPVAVVVDQPRQTRHGIPSPYLGQASAYRPVVRCRISSAITLEVVALEDAVLGAGSADELAARLNRAVPRSQCAAVAGGS